MDAKPPPPTPAATAKAHALSFAGTVADRASGMPIEGVTVTVHRLGKRVGDRRGEIAAATDHRTDAQGEFTFIIPPDQAAQDPYLEL